MAAGQRGMALHTMAILQAYQADVFKEMDEGDGLTPEAVKELHKATDFTLRATKHTARAVGRSMAGSVAAERHLWLNLMEIWEKENVFLLDAPISQTGLFGEAVSSVVEKFQSAKSQSTILRQFMPRRTRDPSNTPSSSLSREGSLPRKEPAFKGSTLAHPPPTTVWGARGRLFPHRRPRRWVDLKQPHRRVFTDFLGGRARPFKRFCPPLTRYPHSDLPHPPSRFWCAETPNSHLQSILGWQSGDASGFLPLLHVPPSPAACRIGDTFGFLPQPTSPVPATLQSMNKDAKDFPSWWTKSPPPDLIDTPTQVCLPEYNTQHPL